LSFTVSVSASAQQDARRLDNWLSARDVGAAARLGDLLVQALDSLAETPLRGRITGPTTREINVPFGRDAYIIRYRVRGTRVIIARIWHSLEHR
jgi:plasmid stabilization system protein ParE